LRVSERAITVIGEIVTGDKGLSPYRSGPQLVRLFNRHGANDVYSQGFPSRWAYAEDKLREMNDTPALAAVLIDVLDPREYLDSKHDQQVACDHVNSFLEYDGYEVVLDGSMPKIRSREGSTVDFAHPFAGSKEQGHIFIDEQLQKCETKIREGDFDGAITNARSMLEALLREIERELDSNRPEYDGDLPKLYKRVQKLLQLDPARPDIDSTVKQVLSGLVSVVNGVAGISNRMGDRHVRTYEPAKRHAVLVVNAAKTFANFAWETMRDRLGRPAS
jgi:hypothetical protein